MIQKAFPFGETPFWHDVFSVNDFVFFVKKIVCICGKGFVKLMKEEGIPSEIKRRNLQ